MKINEKNLRILIKKREKTLKKLKKIEGSLNPETKNYTLHLYTFFYDYLTLAKEKRTELIQAINMFKKCKEAGELLSNKNFKSFIDHLERKAKKGLTIDEIISILSQTITNLSKDKI